MTENSQNSHLSGSEFRGCDLNFTTRKDGINLRHFRREEAGPSVQELSNLYATVFERKEALSRYMNVPLVSDIVEETLSKAFSQRRPCLATSDDAREISLSWIDVIRHASPDQLESGADGKHYCRVLGMQVQLSDSDCTVIRSGVLQTLLSPLPHKKDVQTEIAVVTSAMTEVTEWNQYISQIIGQNNYLLEAMRSRLEMLHDASRLISLSEPESSSLRPPRGESSLTSQETNIEVVSVGSSGPTAIVDNDSQKNDTSVVQSTEGDHDTLENSQVPWDGSDAESIYTETVDLTTLPSFNLV
ncbi:hypothetical protein EYZ11_009305 [Aspergillus tanneri]|uniref:Uncharacterized protein n=1 Tax=Aspergillus tanneri TaxID=1220188 RepID=A0A4S3J8M4_9EURO|nr:hypothetical protein EYZ11_009305 [Aspergillus tanneri]